MATVAERKQEQGYRLPEAAPRCSNCKYCKTRLEGSPKCREGDFVVRYSAWCERFEWF